MKPILLATDGSPTAQRATRTAIDLAKSSGAPLVVATVWEITYQPVGLGLGFAPAIPDLSRYRREEALQILEQTASDARDEGVAVETVIRRGIPGHEVPAIADEKDVQLIVMGSHGWGALKQLVFGSVSTAVLHHASRPVLIVPRTAESEMKTVVEGYGDSFKDLPVRRYRTPTRMDG